MDTTLTDADDISRRQAIVQEFIPFSFGNATPSISLSEWPESPLPHLSGQCEVIIDENDPDKLYQLLSAIVSQSPNVVEICTDNEACQATLKDHHLRY